MQVPPQIMIRDVPGAALIEPRVVELVAHLEKFAPRLIGCRVLVERRHLRHRHGNSYHVRIDLTLPGKEIVVNRDPPERKDNEDVQAAITDAFDAAQRRLEDAVRERRGDVKSHQVPLAGQVVRLSPDRQFGFLRAADGHEVYFNRRSVIDGSFDDLAAGSPVAFAEEAGDEGMQAAWFRKSAGPIPIG